MAGTRESADYRWSQHARDLAQKTCEVRIAMGRFHVDDCVEGVGVEGQLFGIALHKIQSVNLVSFLAEPDGDRIQIQRGVVLRLKRAGDVSSATAVTAAYLQDRFSAQRYLRRDMVIELDAGTMRLILRPERDAERRFSFKSVVEEKHAFIA